MSHLLDLVQVSLLLLDLPELGGDLRVRSIWCDLHFESIVDDFAVIEGARMRSAERLNSATADPQRQWR
jgi:hypothetical protein